MKCLSYLFLALIAICFANCGGLSEREIAELDSLWNDSIVKDSILQDSLYRYHHTPDLSFNMLQGRIKSCYMEVEISEGVPGYKCYEYLETRKGTLEFDEEGNLTNDCAFLRMSENFAKKIVRNEQGCITQCVSSSSDRYEREYDIQTDEMGRSVNDDVEYDGDNINPVKINGDEVFYYDFDEYGNWTKATWSLTYGTTNSFDYNVTRKLEYYDCNFQYKRPEKPIWK